MIQVYRHTSTTSCIVHENTCIILIFGLLSIPYFLILTYVYFVFECVCACVCTFNIVLCYYTFDSVPNVCLKPPAHIHLCTWHTIHTNWGEMPVLCFLNFIHWILECIHMRCATACTLTHIYYKCISWSIRTMNVENCQCRIGPKPWCRMIAASVENVPIDDFCCVACMTMWTTKSYLSSCVCLWIYDTFRFNHDTEMNIA